MALESRKAFSTPLKFRLGQALAYAVRLKHAAIADWLFKEKEGQNYLSRWLFGYQFVCDVSRSATHQMLFLNGERSIEERDLVSCLLNPGDHAVDIGANIGYYLLMLERQIGPEGKVTLIEPSLENLPELKLNIEANKFRNTVLHEIAIGMQEKPIGLKTGINSGIVEDEPGAYQVQMKTLDSIVSDRVDFLKIDVEGYEGQVLRGAVGVIQRDKPLIFLEMHPHMVERFGFTTCEIVQILETYYSHLIFYRRAPTDDENAFSRVLSRYSSRSPLQTIQRVQQFLDDCETGRFDMPFWIVCKADADDVIQ